jgi:cell pole-organizing protein PopZ
MSKPQSATDPSMEDILASIRKMISEERTGPRPVPDQMSRTPFGEATSAKAEEAEARADEPQPGAQPQFQSPSQSPSQVQSLAQSLPESPSQLEPARRAEPAADAGGPREAQHVGETPSAPSFSSLSDALKAAAKPSPQHRSLDEKIADMLDKGPAPAAPAQPVTVDPLAVFAASRTARQGPGSTDPALTPGRSEYQMPTGLKPGAGDRIGRDEASSGPTGGATPSRLNGLNGSSAAHAEPKPSFEQGTVVPLTSDMPSGRRDTPSGRPSSGSDTMPDKAAGRGATDENNPDDKTVISIPGRGTGAPTAGQAGSPPPKSGGLNGATVAPFGPRPLPGSTGVPRAEAAGGPTGKAPLADPKDPLQPSLEDIAKAMRPDLSAPADAPAAPPKPGTNFNFLGETPPAEEAAAKPKPAAGARAAVPPTVDEIVAKIAASHAADAAARMLRDKGGESRGPAGPAAPAKSELSNPDPAKSGLARTGPMQAEAPGAAPKPPGEAAAHAPRPAEPEPNKTKGGPSEALLDAVVDLVHAEPSSLSVFASGSAFINGIGEEDPGAPAGAENKPKDPPKLDRAASELLRPMLRQWLAENMPRIVEEALRSELDSSQEPGQDPKKS